MQNPSNTAQESTSEERNGQTGEKCPTCGQAKPRRKKKYFVFFLLFLLIAYCTKSLYEKACRRAVIIGLMNDLLNTKTVASMNLSKDTKQTLLYLAELAASSPAKEREDILPGMLAEKNGAVAKHPVVIIPGIANTNLELWKTKKESNAFFRKKIWGSHSTVTFMLHNRKEWFKSMKLDKNTGMDPEGVKVRASPGLESSDFSIPGMWFWWKIVENLSYLEYDASMVHFAAFDWRLGMEELERRDKYFTKLQRDIENQKSMRNEKSVVLAHSLGSLVFHYFMQWVSDKDPLWVDAHIHSVVYIGAPLLGAPKALSCLLTGETGSTVHMGVIQDSLLELLFGREERKTMFSTWTSAVYLLPKGGAVFWEGSPSPDKATQPCLVNIAHPNGTVESLGMDAIFKEVEKSVSPYNQKILKRIINPKTVQDTWSNPLVSPLPNAPNLTIYSLYGINKITERGYNFIRKTETDLAVQKKYTDLSKDIFHGINVVDGDGTVPLVSTGYMGYSGWKSKELNLHGVKTVNKEYRHKPSKSIFAIRGGTETAQHVNILGNTELITDILSIVSGKEVTERILSKLPEIAEEIERRKKEGMEEGKEKEKEKEKQIVENSQRAEMTRTEIESL
ncbi:phospholipid:diacylglycerol acyltransferase [Nematocida sp. AWRm77]|nr:phospholipid:diacylglycerol acyltransferase [Nematocida sp. AWRm77]